MTIEELLIKLGVDNAGLRSGMASSREEVQHFEKQTSSSMATAGRAMDDAGTHSSKLGGVFHMLGGAASVFTGMIAAEAVPALIDMGKHAMDLVTQEDAINKQTEAVIASTGGLAHVSAGQVDDLAMSMMKLTGIDDETIKTTENMLLTFTSVRNEVGAGNDIFTQATQAATDMSVALGEDGKSAAMQLGKALNDPIAGVTALQRVGVKLTETQKEQVKALVESGDTLGAQKVILKELSTEFGGSAQAFGDSSAGAMAKINNSVAEAEKGFAKLVLPMAEAGLQLLPPLIDGVASFSQNIGGLIQQFMGLQPVKETLSFISNAFFDISGAVGALMSGGGIEAFSDSMTGIGSGMLADAGDMVGEWMGNIADAIVAYQPIVLDAFLGVAQGIFDWLVDSGVPMMATAAGKMFDAISKVLPPALVKVGEWIVKNAPVLIGKLGEWGKAFVGWVGDRLPSLLASLGEAIGQVGAWLINSGLPMLADDLVKLGKAFIDWVGPQIPKLVAAVGDMFNKLVAWLAGPAIPQLAGAMGDIGRAGVAAIMDFLVGSKGQTGLLQKFKDWFLNTFVPSLPGLVGNMLGALIGFAGDIGRAILKGLGDALVGIGTALFNAIKGGLEWALDQGIQVGPIKLGIGNATISTPMGNFTIPGLATGVTGFAGGFAVVGEKGPELAWLPRGTNVANADQTRSMMGGRSVTNNVTVNNPVPEPASSSVQRTLLTLGATGHM